MVCFNHEMEQNKSFSHLSQLINDLPFSQIEFVSCPHTFILIFLCITIKSGFHQIRLNDDVKTVSIGWLNQEWKFEQWWLILFTLCFLFWHFLVLIRHIVLTFRHRAPLSTKPASVIFSHRFISAAVEHWAGVLPWYLQPIQETCKQICRNEHPSLQQIESDEERHGVHLRLKVTLHRNKTSVTQIEKTRAHVFFTWRTKHPDI